jgi:tetratricopeptide (TPR) repeat protein
VPCSKRLSRLAVACLLSTVATGCAAGRANSVAGASDHFYSNWFRAKPKIADAPPIQAPSELKNERDLTLKYARWMISCGTGPSLDEATRKYNELLEKDPNDADAMIGLAQIDEINGLPDRAEAGYQKAVDAAPESAGAQGAMARFLAGHKRWPEAVAFYQKAVLADPADRQTRTELAVALVHLGDVEGALPHFIRTVGDAEAHYSAAVVLNEDGRVSDAEQQLRLALAKKPQLLPAKHLLAEIARPQRRAPSVTPALGAVSQPPVVTPASGSSRDDYASPPYQRPSSSGHSVAG